MDAKSKMNDKSLGNVQWNWEKSFKPLLDWSISSKTLSTNDLIIFNSYYPGTYDFNPPEKQLSIKINDKTESHNNDSKTIKKKYEELYKKYLDLLSENSRLNTENEKLKLLAHKSYLDLKEEIDYEISSTTMHTDSLLVLMELRENRRLNYLELIDRVTLPGQLFLRLAELTNINYITVDKETGYFSITAVGNAFLKNREL